MRQPKIILIFRHKCVVFFSVNTQSVTVTYWKSSFVRCLTMNVACQGRTLSQTVCLCVVSQSQAVTFECRVVHRSDGLCGDMPIGENITREIMEVFFKVLYFLSLDKHFKPREKPLLYKKCRLYAPFFVPVKNRGTGN